jgi:hypothetical protein
MATCEWRTAELLDRLQNGIHKGKRRGSRPVNMWKVVIRDSMQRRNLKDEKCFNQELWKKKKICLWVEETVYSQRNSVNNNNNNNNKNNNNNIKDEISTCNMNKEM